RRDRPPGRRARDRADRGAAAPGGVGDVPARAHPARLDRAAAAIDWDLARVRLGLRAQARPARMWNGVRVARRLCAAAARAAGVIHRGNSGALAVPAGTRTPTDDRRGTKCRVTLALSAAAIVLYAGVIPGEVVWTVTAHGGSSAGSHRVEHTGQAGRLSAGPEA